MEFPQFGYVFFSGIIKRKLAGVAQLEDGHGGEALGHGSNAEDSIACYWLLVGQIAKSASTDVRHLAVDHDAPGRAGYMFPFQKLPDEAIDFRKSRFELGATGRVGKLRVRWRRPEQANHGDCQQCRDEVMPIAVHVQSTSWSLRRPARSKWIGRTRP